MSTRVAVLGTGRMGTALAKRLTAAGLDLTLWNRTRSRAEQVGVGRVMATPADAVRDATFVISSLTGPEAVRDTYGGPDGALSSAHGLAFIEMSTAGPDVIAELAPQVDATASTLIDAPIVGAPTVVLRGEGAILAGGRVADVERARAVLDLLGEVRHVGPLGSGARLKLVANSMLGAVTLAAAELQRAGEAALLEPEDVFWVLGRLAPSLEMRRRGYLDDVHEPTLFAVRDLRKDLDLSLGVFHRTGSSVPVIALVRELVDEAVALAGDRDITAVIERYPRRPAPSGHTEA